MFENTARTAKGAALGLAAAVALTCGGWAGSPIATAATPDHFLVIAGAASSNIEVLRVEDAGALSTVPGSPFPTGTGALSLTATPDGNTVYVAHTVSGTISGFHLGADGKLTPVPGAQLDLGAPAVGFVVSPDGSRLFATIGGAVNEVRSYDIAPSGALTPTGAPPTQLPGLSALTMPTLSPDGRFLFTASWINLTVSSYAVQPDASLRPVAGPIFAGLQPTLQSVTPDGRFLYVSNEASDGIAGFAIGPDGQLTPTPGSPYRAGVLPHGPAITADSKRLYIATAMSDSIGGLSIGDNGVLTPLPGSPYPAPAATLPGRVVLDEAAHRVFLIDALTAHGTTQVHSYSIAANGSLAPTGNPPIDTGLLFSDGPDATLVTQR
ncbi:beta-propeller fold lactonase family protein [Nocardia elegans]|uniref:lactonase family protein n=1 Tax=Nocardia elegans TaxID=300029 RepID=UPI001892D51C|nr:beta-propeller fold lactonase family protein [Nocardia elegans]MBF6245684.1 beta-propeller fold lactonase family protein [Nocardia elegans]